MKRRILAVLLCCALLLGVVPIFAHASDAEELVYISISDDARYAEGNDDAGTIMAYVPVKLSDLAEIKLSDYDLDQYITLDEDNNEKITVLHLFIYTLKNYYGSTDEDAMTISGSPGSLFFNAFWGHDCNLTYYVNGEYPMAGPGWGATADSIELKDGDFIDLSMYTSWAFFMDSAAGYHFFTDADGKIVHEYTVPFGQSLSIKYMRFWESGMGEGGGTAGVIEPNATISYSQTFYSNTASKATTDENGTASITFDKAGTWYLWADGQCGASEGNEEDIVSSPAYAKVNVVDPDRIAADAVAQMILALPAPEDITLEDAEAVAEAQQAYENLTEAQQAYVSDETLAYLEDAVAALLALEELPFTDLTQDWYESSIRFVYQTGLMVGTTDTTFGPDAALTRGQFAAILYRLAGEPAVEGECSFSDVTPGFYYEKAIIWANENGIVYGDKGRFNPDDEITREAMAAMMRRYAALCGLSTSGRADLSAFADASSVSNWARADMQWAVANKLIFGDNHNNLNPGANASRAEAAAILARFVDQLVQ